MLHSYVDLAQKILGRHQYVLRRITTAGTHSLHRFLLPFYDSRINVHEKPQYRGKGLIQLTRSVRMWSCVTQLLA